MENNFKDASKFNPDRWLGDARGSINPYLVLPFGHGMRSCIARRLAEQNILTLLLRVSNEILVYILTYRTSIWLVQPYFRETFYMVRVTITKLLYKNKILTYKIYYGYISNIKYFLNFS